MKLKNISTIIVATLALFAGCNNTEYDVIDNGLYLVDAASMLRSTTVPMGPAGADVTIAVRLAKPVETDVTVSIAFDPAFLEEYNRSNSTSFYCLPAEHADLGENTEMTIRAGEIIAMRKVHVAYFDTEGKRYAMPVALRVLNGNTTAIKGQSKFVYVLDRKLFVRVPAFKFKSGNGAAIDAKPLVVTDSVTQAKTGGWNLSLPAYTIEFWAKLEKYNTQNFGLIEAYGNDATIPDNYEYYFRFGDANSGASEPDGSRNYINWKAWGAQLTGAFELAANRWNHWATRYDGSMLTVYRNGEEYLKVSAKYPGSNWVIHTFKMITSHASTANTLNLCQVRIWKKALSQAQIKNGMYYEADVSDPDLEAYWKMDEGPDGFANLFRDATGHGHDAVLNTAALASFSWTDPQGFE
jgi:hypothetical protein